MPAVPAPYHLLQAHPLRGALFENWVITELMKAQANRGLNPAVHFLRDKEGHEVDALVETGPASLLAVEAKSGETLPSDAFRGLEFWQSQLPGRNVSSWLVDGGDAMQTRTRATVLPWQHLEPLLAALEP